MNNLEYATGLRALADFLDQHPDMPVPHYGITLFCDTKEQFLKGATVLAKGGKVDKHFDSPNVSWPKVRATRRFGELEFQVQIDRPQLCRMVRPAEYECPESFLAEVSEGLGVELADQETAEGLAATAKESIEAAQ